jgi:hypothetical protein
MNTKHIASRAISSLVFCGLLLTGLPAFSNPYMTAFQAFVLTPAVIILAALAAIALNHVLESALDHLGSARPAQSASPSARVGEAGPASCLTRHRQRRTGTKATEQEKTAGTGRRAA